MKNLLLTGSAGFVGKWVSSLLKDKYHIFSFEDVDITQVDQVKAYLSDKTIDVVIHLAAQSFVPYSFKNPLETYKVNFEGTHHLLSALQDNAFTGRFLYVSSSDVYGRSVADFPVIETHATQPLNPYSVSKCAAEALAYQWSQNADFDVIIARPFNHIGPGQRADFVVSDFAQQCAEIKNGKRAPVISTGNINVSRDFTDVRDVVWAYDVLLDKGVNGETYNICSGKDVLISNILKQLIQMSGKNITVETDPARLRKTDIAKTYGSYKKLFAATGWQPNLNLDNSLSDIFNFWDKTE